MTQAPATDPLRLSPLWHAGVLSSAIEQRFDARAGLPWVATRIPTQASAGVRTLGPGPTRTQGLTAQGGPGQPQAPLAAPVYVLTGYDESQAKSLLPRIVVIAGQDVGGRSEWLGNVDQTQSNAAVTHRMVHHSGTRETDVSIEVHSQLPGEAHQIGFVVAMFLRMMRPQLRVALGVKDLTPVALNPPVGAQNAWMCAIQTRLYIEDHWVVANVYPELSAIQLDINDAQEGGDTLLARVRSPSTP